MREIATRGMIGMRRFGRRCKLEREMDRCMINDLCFADMQYQFYSTCVYCLGHCAICIHHANMLLLIFIHHFVDL